MKGGSQTKILLETIFLLALAQATQRLSKPTVSSSEISNQTTDFSNVDMSTTQSAAEHREPSPSDMTRVPSATDFLAAYQLTYRHSYM